MRATQEFTERGHSGAAATLSQAPRAERIGGPNPAGRDSPAGFSASMVAQLLTLANFRNLELCQAIRLARMQLPANSPTIGGLEQERQINRDAIAQLEQLQRVAA